MFSWLDLLLIGVVLWETMSGYLHGLMKAGFKVCAIVAATLLPLPFTANCSVYLKPMVEPVVLTSIGLKVVSVSTDQYSWAFLGPWQGVIGFPAGPGNAYLQRILSLAVNIAGLSFLVIVLLLAFTLLSGIKPPRNPAWLGALIGFGSGVLLVVLFLVLAPVWVLAEDGVLLSSALEQSGLAQILSPLVQKLVMAIAPFVF